MTLKTEGGDPFTQYICTSEPFCLCVGGINPNDECDCTASDDGKLWTTCTYCEAPMELIDFETGETIKGAV